MSLDVNFNESLTNDIVSFEQLGPEVPFTTPCWDLIINSFDISLFLWIWTHPLLQIEVWVNLNNRMANSVNPDETACYEPSHLDLHCLQSYFKGLDKIGYQVNSFLISSQKHMLLVLIRSALPRRF